MKEKIKVSLSEDATKALLIFMKDMRIDSPTHCVNVILTNLHKLKHPSPSEEKYNEGNKDNH